MEVIADAVVGYKEQKKSLQKLAIYKPPLFQWHWNFDSAIFDDMKAIETRAH